jgi:pimeloyl-ACP methyl ester carboxylesterase
MPFVDNKGIKIHYVVEGQGPSIVMLHGGPGSHKEWYVADHVNSLKNKYQLILVDLRGNGQSDKPHDSKSYLTKNFTSDIIAVLDDLKIEKAHCWGYSLGGYLAFCLSRDYPKRFHSFIIGGSHPQGLTKVVIALLKHIREKLKDGADGLIALSKESGEEISPEYEKSMRADFKAINAWCHSEDIFCKVDEHLPKLDIPFLFYAGENDRWNPYPHLVEISKEMKNAKTILFENKGHEVQFVKGLVLPHVLEFLENLL